MKPTQTERIVEYIRTHPGCSMLEIAYGVQPFIANPRARISDARAAGVNIPPPTRDRDGVERYHVEEEPEQLAWTAA